MKWRGVKELIDDFVGVVLGIMMIVTGVMINNKVWCIAGVICCAIYVIIGGIDVVKEVR